MNLIFSLFSILFFLAVTTFSSPPTVHAQAKTPVLIELFTAEGCIRCPPAEQNLAFLEKEQPFNQAEIIALALHVDYWDGRGWKDEYSSPLFTQRQNIYGQRFKVYDLFTPQMVVDGSEQFPGTDLAKAQKAVVESSKRTKAKIELSKTADVLKVKISGLPAAHENTSVYLAVAESGLNKKVFSGLNDGKTLTLAAVTRELRPLGIIAPTVHEMEVETVLQLQPAWKKENLKFVVFLQENQSRKILGVGVIRS